MKTKNEVLMVSAAMMVFFRNVRSSDGFFGPQDEILNLLTDDEFYLLEDNVRDVHEELYSTV